MSPRLETRKQLKCRSCRTLVATVQYSYSQKKRKHRRRCPPCVKYLLFLRGDGPRVAKPANMNAPESKEEYGRIELTEQLLPPQKLSGVTHLKAIVVVEPASASGPGQRRARKTESHIPATYQNSSSSSTSKAKSSKKSSSSTSSSSSARKSRDERDVVEELLNDDPSAASSPSSSKEAEQLQFEQAEAGFVGGKQLDVEEASQERFTKLKATPKPKHQRTPSTSDQARALYMRQLSGRKKIRASRDFDNEEEPPELLKGEKGRKRLGVLEGGYPRESMKPGPERVIGGH